MIEISNLEKSFKDKKVLKNVNIQLNDSKKIYALMGESGSGKSTLFNILFGLDKDYQGTYKLFDTDAQSLKSKDWDYLRSNEISMVFQDFKLIENLTVYENLYISGHYSNNEIDNILKEMDLLNVKEEYVKNISGGQKQRVALSRGILKEPKILLLDEPTGNLDGMTAQKIMNYLDKLRNKGILVFIITHDEGTLKNVDVIYTLENGYIKSDIIETNHSNEKEEKKITFKKDIKKRNHIKDYTLLNIVRNKKDSS